MCVWVVTVFHFFFFNVSSTPEIYTYCHTLSLPDALPISRHVTHHLTTQLTRCASCVSRFCVLICLCLLAFCFLHGVQINSSPIFSRCLADRKSTRLNSSH